MKTTILGHTPEEHTETWQRELFADVDYSDNEKFEMLDAASVEEIQWDAGLNNEYMQWIYINIK